MTISEVVVTVADARSHNIEQYFAIAQGFEFEFFNGDGYVGLVEYGCFHHSTRKLSIFGKMPQQRIHTQEIAVTAKPGNHPQTNRGQHRFMPKFFAGVDV